MDGTVVTQLNSLSQEDLLFFLCKVFVWNSVLDCTKFTQMHSMDGIHPKLFFLKLLWKNKNIYYDFLEPNFILHTSLLLFPCEKNYYQNPGIRVLSEKIHCRVVTYAWTSLTKQIKASTMIWWKHNQVYTISSSRSYSHIFTRKCKKVESKPFQSLSNHQWCWTLNL
jgi:hypothetical protein